MPSAYSMLTIEVYAEMGAVDVFVSRKQPPTPVNYDQQAKCPTLSPSESKVLRLTIPLKGNSAPDPTSKPVAYFVLLVGASSGAKSCIWASASMPPHMRPSDDLGSTVNEILLLSQFGMKNLLQNFETLSSEVKTVASRETLSSIEIASGKDIEQISEPIDDDSDEEAHHFLERSGRAIMQRNSSSGGAPLDPNQHPELFERPHLQSRQDYYENVYPVDSRSDDESGSAYSELYGYMRRMQKQKGAVAAVSEKVVPLPPIITATSSMKLRKSRQDQNNLTARPILPIKYRLTLK